MAESRGEWVAECAPLVAGLLESLPKTARLSFEYEWREKLNPWWEEDGGDRVWRHQKLSIRSMGAPSARQGALGRAEQVIRGLGGWETSLTKGHATPVLMVYPWNG